MNRIDPTLTYKNCNYSSVVTMSDGYTFCERGYLNILRYEGEESENHKYIKKLFLPENTVDQFACFFMKHFLVFIKSPHEPQINHCLMYNIKTKQWTYMADTNICRSFSACAVFEGKIVVSGGCHRRSVEAYDYYEDKWTYLPDMIELRFNHGAVSMGNKMFVIGGHNSLTCEVFDNISRKFTYIKDMVLVIDMQCVFSISAVRIGRKIIVFLINISSVKNHIHIFDTLNDDWSTENNLNDVTSVNSCSKVPFV